MFYPFLSNSDMVNYYYIAIFFFLGGICYEDYISKKYVF